MALGYFNFSFGQILPPTVPWSGKSQEFIRSKTDAWISPSEKSGLKTSPNYDDTINWLKKLVQNSSYLRMEVVGKSSQNRKLWMIIASREGVNSPSRLRANNRPTLLFHAGIHSGEIDGKDAGMMFLRDIVFYKPGLLDSINILFIPVLNPDGHERRSEYNRVNQRGPEKMGWRTNARNLNLNRDFTKAETPEIRALLNIINNWPIQLYVDIHVTDGIDYQYDITYGFNYSFCHSPNINQWLEKKLRPAVNARLSLYGHIPGPLIFAKNKQEPRDGIINWSASARFSNGYGDARHLPTILVENHSLKTYKQRVLATYVFLNAVSSFLAKNGNELNKEISKDEMIRPTKLFIITSWQATELSPDSIMFLGIDYEKYQSPISGQDEINWLGQPVQYMSPVYNVLPDMEVSIPDAYWVPASRGDIIDKLRIHGIEMTLLEESEEVEVEIDKIVGSKLAKTPYEGRVRITIDSVVTEKIKRLYAPGSARISSDQPLGILSAILLEAKSPESFLQWGYFHEILQRTEYIEGYVLDPLAKHMLGKDQMLKAAFDKALQNPVFSNDPTARLQWFYKRSPYYDREYQVYPVGREK
jgi:hypothetical protein